MKRKEIIILALLILVLGVWAFWPKAGGNTVTVTVDGAQVCSLSLSRDSRTPIHGYGDFSLTLVVEDGKARVEESTCPDLICQNHVAISGVGEQIICLPGRVVVTVEGKEAEVDA